MNSVGTGIIRIMGSVVGRFWGMMGVVIGPFSERIQDSLVRWVLYLTGGYLAREIIGGPDRIQRRIAGNRDRLDLRGRAAPKMTLRFGHPGHAASAITTHFGVG